MKPIELPIYFNPDEDIDRAAMGMPEIDIEDCELKYCLFINIDAMSPYKSDKSSDMTKVFSGGTSFITPIPYNSLKAILKDRFYVDFVRVNYEK